MSLPSAITMIRRQIDKHELHVVLDDEKGVAPRVEGEDLLHQGLHQDRIDAGRGLVEEDDPRLRDEGARELEQLELPAREGAGEVPHHRLEAAERDDLARPLAVAHLFAAHRAGREPVVPEPFAALAGRDEHHVLEHRHLRERARNLNTCGQARPRIPRGERGRRSGARRAGPAPRRDVRCQRRC